MSAHLAHEHSLRPSTSTEVATLVSSPSAADRRACCCPTHRPLPAAHELAPRSQLPAFLRSAPKRGLPAFARTCAVAAHNLRMQLLLVCAARPAGVPASALVCSACCGWRPTSWCVPAELPQLRTRTRTMMQRRVPPPMSMACLVFVTSRGSFLIPLCSAISRASINSERSTQHGLCLDFWSQATLKLDLDVACLSHSQRSGSA